MIGALAGDIIGSVHEGRGTKDTAFDLFPSRCRVTDDSVLTLAVAEAIVMRGGGPTVQDYAQMLRKFGRLYPTAGYGGSFRRWLQSDAAGPYNSWGNGSAMRSSPVGWAFDSETEVLAQAANTAAPTHNHPEGVKGAQAIALAVFLARKGADKNRIRGEIERRFAYDLHRTIDAIRPGYRFDVSCQGSVPEAIIAFLDSNGVEEAIRTAISLGGDADTQACMAGAIAEAHYGGMPEGILAFVLPRLDDHLLSVTARFARRYLLPPAREAVAREVLARRLRR